MCTWNYLENPILNNTLSFVFCATTLRSGSCRDFSEKHDHDFWSQITSLIFFLKMYRIAWVLQLLRNGIRTYVIRSRSSRTTPDANNTWTTSLHRPASYLATNTILGFHVTEINQSETPLPRNWQEVTIIHWRSSPFLPDTPVLDKRPVHSRYAVPQTTRRPNIIQNGSCLFQENRIYRLSAWRWIPLIKGAPYRGVLVKMNLPI